MAGGRAPRTRPVRAAGKSGPLQRDVPDVMVRSAIVSMRGVGFPGHVHKPDVAQRREHRGACPDDDVVAAIAQAEPVTVALPLVAPEVETDPVAEDRAKRARRCGHRCRLGHHNDRAPSTGETFPHGVDGGGLLILGRRPQDERSRGPADRSDQLGSTPISGERCRGRRSTRPLRDLRSLRAIVDGLGEVGLFTRYPRRRKHTEHRRERRDVSLADPPRELEHRFIEEPNRRHEPRHREHPNRKLVGGADDPRARQLAVEPDADVRADPGTELGRERVRERPVEREDRSVDADRDRAGERLRRRRRSGARRRDPWPPRGTPCARNARRRPSPGRSDEPDPGPG